MQKGGAVYMIANQHNNVLYVGATIDLFRRTVEHKEKFYPKSFTARYNCDKLVYFELFHSAEEAFAREKTNQEIQTREKGSFGGLN